MTTTPEWRRARAAAAARQRSARHARLLADPTIAPHGTASTYDNFLCRCPACWEAKYAVIKDQRQRARAART